MEHRLPCLLVQSQSAAPGGHDGSYNWLGVLDETHHFVFLEGVPVRFFHGDAAEPSKRALRQQESEAQQLALALGTESTAEGLMFRLALETDDAGAVTRVVFLALRGEEGHVECFWPVPRDDEPSIPTQGQLSMARQTPRRV